MSKQELETTNGSEVAQAKHTFVPQVDIWESDDAVTIVADMPGVDESGVDITLDKNVLSIHGSAAEMKSDGYDLAYGEYRVGDYRRKFSLSNEINLSKIEANMNGGVLKIHLPKVDIVQTKRIAVTAG